MVQIDWGGYQNALARIPNAGEAFQAGMQQGRALRKEQQYDAALKGYAAKPDDPLAQNALLPFNPELAIRAQQMSQERKRYAEQAPARELEQKVKQLEFAGKVNDYAIELLGSVRDEPSYQAAKAQYAKVLQENGLPVPPLPEQFSPQVVRELQMQTLSTKERLEHELKAGKIEWVTGPWGAFSTNAQGIPVAPGQMNAPVSPQPPMAAPQGAESPAPGFDAFHSGFLAPAEGGFVASDGRSGAPANFGVNQKANPDVDVRNLTPDAAKRIMYERYWKPSGADNIQDPGLQAVHADTAVNMGVGRAKQFLEQSGGDPQKYLALRESFYRKLGGADLNGWLARNEKLSQYIGGQGSPARGSMPSIQEQAMSGVIQVGEKPPPGYRQTPEGTYAAIPGGPGDKSQERSEGLRKEAADVRKEFNGLPLVKEFNSVRGSLKKIQTLATSVPDGAPGRAQADMALIFSFMKALDPDSVVRETEYANAQNAAGVPERVRNLYNAALTGQKLSPEQRAGMVRSAQDIYFETASTYNETAKQYHQYFRDLGVKNPGTYAPLAVAPLKGRPNRAPAKQAPQGGKPTIRVISRVKRGS